MTAASALGESIIFTAQRLTDSGSISIKIAANMKPAPRAIRYFRSLVSRRWAPEDASSSPPARLARAAKAPNNRSVEIPVIVKSGGTGILPVRVHAQGARATQVGDYTALRSERGSVQ